MTWWLALPVVGVLLLCGAARAQQAEDRVHVWGRVEAPSGEPIAGATARLADAPGAEATSGEDGRYRVAMDLAGPAPAELRLVLSAPGRVERTIWLPTDAGLSIPVGTHVLWAGGVLEGVVLDEQGKPLGELDFAVFHGDGLFMPARTDAAGRFRVEPISAGLLRFAIDGDTERHLEADEPPAIRFGETARATLRRAAGTVSGAQSLRSLHLITYFIGSRRLPPAGIRGRVTSRGLPVVGAQVCAVPAQRGSIGSTLAGTWGPTAPRVVWAVASEDGSFELSSHVFGRFFVRAEAPGLGPGESEPFEFRPGVLAEDIQIDLAPAGSIEGRVLVREGDDPEGFLVGACRDDGFPLFRRARADGSFRFDGLGAGRWRVRTFVDELSNDRPEKHWGSSFAEPESTLAVEPGAIARADLDRRGVITVRGQVLFPCPGETQAAVTPLDPERRKERRRSRQEFAVSPLDAEGRFVLHGEATRQAIFEVVFEAGPETTVSLFETRPIEPSETIWRVGAEFGRLEGDGGRVEEGRPRGFDGEGIDSKGRRLTFRSRLRDDGSFVVPTLPAGRWRLRFAERKGESDGDLPSFTVPVASPLPLVVEVCAGQTTRVEIP